MKHCDSDQANAMPYQLRQDKHDYMQGTIDTWARNFHAQPIDKYASGQNRYVSGTGHYNVLCFLSPLVD